MRATSHRQAGTSGRSSPTSACALGPSPGTDAALIPLRLFLGFSFTWSGLSKLADPHFFAPRFPSSIQDQLAQNIPHSPITPILRLAAHQPVLIGTIVALGEIAVGLGALFGLLGRLAASGGCVLSAVFWLATSWHTSPPYQSADLVFLVAWTPLVLAGGGGVASLDKHCADRQQRRPGASPKVTRRAQQARLRCTAALGAAGAVLAASVAIVGHFLAAGR
jgi:thiosulfate dehydrogenase (quinone) large subunit